MIRYFMRTDHSKLVRVTGLSGVYKRHLHDTGFPCHVMARSYKEITEVEFAVLRMKGWTVLVSVDVEKDDA